MESCISGVGKLKRGKDISFEEADAISTLWHEITHNRHKGNPIKMTQTQILRMELANEFVARNTIDEFYTAYNMPIQHPQLTKNRSSTDYNTPVKKFDSIIKILGLNNKDVLNDVKEHLFNKSYTTQTTGLINAIKNNGGLQKLTEREIALAIIDCDRYEEIQFKKKLKKLLVK